MQSAKASAGSESPFRIGQSVVHPKFGQGTVVSAEGQGTDARLQGEVRAHADHRIAMAFGILGATRNTEITVDDRDCVAVSYPGFWSDLKRVSA